MPKILLYALIGVLGVIVLKSLVAPKVPQTLVVTPKPTTTWWQDLIGVGSDVYHQIWGTPSTPTGVPASGATPAAGDEYLTPSWLGG